MLKKKKALWRLKGNGNRTPLPWPAETRRDCTLWLNQQPSLERRGWALFRVWQGGAVGELVNWSVLGVGRPRLRYIESLRLSVGYHCGGSFTSGGSRRSPFYTKTRPHTGLHSGTWPLGPDPSTPCWWPWSPTAPNTHPLLSVTMSLAF